MKNLTRKALLTKEVLAIEKVNLTKDTCVHVRQMTAFERDLFEQQLRDEIKGKDGQKTYEMNISNFRAKLATCTICDEKGDLILTPRDADRFSKSISAHKMETIINAAQKLNNITEDDKEGLVKN